MGVCPSCQRELPGQFPFCPFCGESTAPQTAAREERKVVSVLFVDLVGFTARAERLDPEDVRSLLGPYHAHVRAELERFGGTVEKFIGDAVMALFGAPTAHEDDPERAVRAALAIHDWADEEGDELQVRIAVNTGEALVTLDARPGEGEGMAAGDVVNVAARLQTAAPLNGVLVGELTYRATADVFDYRAAEPVVAKGKAEPLPAWEALAPRARFGVDLTRGTSTPLVGRVRELDLLVSTLERVRAAARRLDLDGDLLAALAGQRAGPWVDAAQAHASGDFVKAAALLDEIGSLPDEAEARLRAAEQLSQGGRAGAARSQLGQAIAFYRSVRAMRYEDECGVLLAAAG
jgi:class 3 adenylate cyclase